MAGGRSYRDRDCGYGYGYGGGGGNDDDDLLLTALRRRRSVGRSALQMDKLWTNSKLARSSLLPVERGVPS